MSKRGFTLIELLVVIAILGILMSMLTPILLMASRQAKASATRTVMAKTETALRLFRADIGAFPWQQEENQPDDGPWTNQLYYHLGTQLDPADWSKVRQDAQAAASLYAYKIDKSVFPQTFPNKHVFRAEDGSIDDVGNIVNYEGGRAFMLNRMAIERARLAIFSGHYRVPGCALPTPFLIGMKGIIGSIPVNRRVIEDPADPQPLLPAPKSVSRPGWASDYLRGELEKRYVSGTTILDGWGHVIVYIGQIIEGMTAAPVLSLGGLRTLNTRAVEFGLEPIGRFSLAPRDAITGLALGTAPRHRAAFLPDTANLRHSDRRRYAAMGLELEFELWSAGPDGQHAWMRDDRANADNVSLTPYDKSIP